MNNCRGQIGETLTWVVATIVIVIILSISIFVVSFGGFLGEKKFSEYDPIQSDLIFTKSFSGFLIKNKDFVFDSVNRNNFESFESKFSPLLAKSVVKGDFFGWNMDFIVDDVVLSQVISRAIIGADPSHPVSMSICYYMSRFYLNPKIKFDFSGEYSC